MHREGAKTPITKPKRLAFNFCAHSLLVESKPIPSDNIDSKQAPNWCPDLKQLKMDLK